MADEIKEGLKTSISWLELASYVADPTDTDSRRRGLCFVGTTLKQWTGSAWAGISGSGGASSWDGIYDVDQTLDIDVGSLTFAIAPSAGHLAEDGFIVTGSAALTGDCIKITNSGSGKDISGTSDTWDITKAGVITATGLTMVDSEVITLGTGSDATIQWDTAKLDIDAAAINFDGDTTVESGHDLIITSGSLTYTAGDMTMSDGSIAITDADDANTLIVTNNSHVTSTSATSGMVEFQSTSITDGVLLNLELTEATLSGGYYLRAYDVTAGSAVFTVGEDGAVVITGAAEGTDAITLTDGDITVTDGDLTLSGGFAKISEDATDKTVLDIDTAGTSVDAVTINADALTGTESAVSVSVDALVDGVGLKIENTGEALTSGELLQIKNTEGAGNIATITGNLCSITSDIEENAGTLTADYDMMLFSRADTQAHASQYDAQGSVVKILKTLDKAAGTIVDAVIGLEIESAVANTALPLGDTVKITEVGVGARALNIVAAGVGASDVLITGSGAHTNQLAALEIATSGALATGGCGFLYTASGSPTADSRGLEMDVQKDMRAMYIDTDAVTNDAIYVTHSGNLADGKAVMHITDAGIPAADTVYVGHFAFTGTATNESVVLFADGGGKDVTGLYVDADCVDTAANLSAQATFFSDAAGNLPVLMQFYHSDAGAAAGEIQTRINFYGSDDAPAKELYAKIEVESDDVAAANPDGILWIYGDLAGTITASAGFTGNKVLLGAAASTLTTAGAWDLTLSTASTASNEPRIVLTDGATGNITITAGGTSGEIDFASPFLASSTQSLSGAGAVSLTESITEITNGGSEAITLAAGVEGQIKFLTYISGAGTSTLTPSPLAGGTTIAFDAVGETATLIYTNSSWQIIAVNGATIA